MGFFDSIKNALGGKEKSAEGIKGPSLVLKEAGIDPSAMDFKFGADGLVTITGQVKDQATLEKVGKIVGEIPQISTVKNELVVGVPKPEVTEAEAEPAPAAEVGPAADPVAETAPPAEPSTPAATETQPADAAAESMETYTVQPGDSLWKIAAAHYGSGNRYHAIFDANRDILDNPDLIKPGQVLKLPPR